jgi:hypothetical protein
MGGASTFCASFVRAVLPEADVGLCPGIAVRHTTPEHVGATAVAHGRWERIRDGA